MNSERTHQLKVWFRVILGLMAPVYLVIAYWKVGDISSGAHPGDNRVAQIILVSLFSFMGIAFAFGAISGRWLRKR